MGKMRLSRKINYDRFLELNESKELRDVFDKKYPDGGKIEGLNFHLVIEYENAFDSIDYENMFPDNSAFVDFQSLKKEHSNIITRIKRQIDNKKIPDFLKKIGVTNILKGCYLVGHTNKDLSKNIKTSSKKSISIKFEYNKVPKEIADLCDDYYVKNVFSILREKEEFDLFFKMTKKEQEKEIAALFQQFSNYTNKSILFSMMNSGDTIQPGIKQGLTVEELFEKNIDFFNDISFLEQVFESAKEDENYELCQRILDRIKVLKNI